MVENVDSVRRSTLNRSANVFSQQAARFSKLFFQTQTFCAWRSFALYQKNVKLVERARNFEQQHQLALSRANNNEKQHLAGHGSLQKQLQDTLEGFAALRSELDRISEAAAKAERELETSTKKFAESEKEAADRAQQQEREIAVLRNQAQRANHDRDNARTEVQRLRIELQETMIGRETKALERDELFEKHRKLKLRNADSEEQLCGGEYDAQLNVWDERNS